MSSSVGINKMSVVHKGSGGISSAFPDVCKTPTPGGPVPIPYPNISKAGDVNDGSSSVECDGNAVCLKSSSLSPSTGDEAGSAGGGVASNKMKGKSELVNYSFDVSMEGKGVARALDPLLHNDKNTPPFPIIQGPVAVMGKQQLTCYVCKKDIS